MRTYTAVTISSLALSLVLGVMTPAIADCDSDSVRNCLDDALDSAKQVFSDPANAAQHLRDAGDTATNCMQCGLQDFGEKLHDFSSQKTNSYSGHGPANR